MFGDKSKLSSIVAIILAGCYTQQASATPYPDIDSMLLVVGPNAAINAPELNSLILALDALPTQQQKYLALQSLIPAADGSLRAASEGPMRQILSVMSDRLIKVTAQTGVSSGDSLIDAAPAPVDATHDKKIATKTAEEAKLKTVKTAEEAKLKAVKTVEEANPKAVKTVEEANPKAVKTVEEAKPKAVKAAVHFVSNDPADPEIITPNSTATTNDKQEPAAAIGSADAAKVESKEKDQKNAKKDDALNLENKDKNNATADTAALTAGSDTATAETTPAVPETPKEIVHGAWIQVLGDNIGQGVRGIIPGYDADVWGIVIGRDYLVCPRLAIGAAIGYQNAQVEQRNISGSYLDIKRFQGTLYAGYRFISPFYLNMAVTYAHNDYDNNRNILVPPVGGVPFVRIAHADFDAEEFNAYAEFGYTWSCGKFRAIPKLMLMYSFFDVEDYVEEDAFGLDLYTRYRNMEFLPLGAGIKLEYQNEFEKAYVVPEIHAYAFHDFSNDKQIAAALFTAGGFEFLNQGVSPSENSIEVGAGIAVHSYQNTSVTLQYDYASRSDYHRHAAFIKVRHEWA